MLLFVPCDIFCLVRFNEFLIGFLMLSQYLIGNELDHLQILRENYYYMESFSQLQHINLCITLPKGNSLPKTAVQNFLHMWHVTTKILTHVKFHCFNYGWLIEIIMCKNFILLLQKDILRHFILFLLLIVSMIEMCYIAFLLNCVCMYTYRIKHLKQYQL